MAGVPDQPSPYKLTYKAELMQDYTTRVPLPSSKEVAGTLDENGQPIVFSIGYKGNIHDGELMMTYSDTANKGFRMLTLTEAFHIKGPVTHLAVSQASTGEIYLIFAAQASANNSKLYVCRGLQPQAWKDKTVSAALIPCNVSVKQVLVDKISLPPLFDDSKFDKTHYPLAVVTSRNEKGTLDMWRIIVDNQTGTWEFGHRGMPQLSANPKVIHDHVVSALSPWQVALNVLYEDKDSRLYLDANIIDSRFPTASSVTRLSPPANARAVIGLANGNSHDLLVGGDGLYHFSADSLIPDSSVSTGALVSGSRVSPSGDEYLLGVQSMYISQQSITHREATERSSADQPIDHVASVWFNNSKGVIGYCTVTARGEMVRSERESIPINTIDTISMAPMFGGGKSKNHHIIYLDRLGQHYLLTQPSTTAIWEERPWTVPGDEGEITTFNSFTMQISVHDKDGTPLPRARVKMTAYDDLSVTVNNKHVTVRADKTTADVVETDAAGTLHVVLPTPDAGGSSILTVYDEKNRKIDYVDPARSMNGKYSVITEDTDLRRQPLQGGGQLGDGNSTSSDSDTWKSASKHITKMHSHLQTLPASGKRKDITSPIQPEGFLDDVWAAWHWIEGRVEDVVDFVVRTENEVVSFVITIGEKVQTFVLDCAKKVLKAINWVLKKIKLAMDTIIKWVGLFLEWTHVIDNYKAISMLATTFTQQIPVWTGEGETSILNGVGELIKDIKDILHAITDDKTTVGHYLNLFSSKASTDPQRSLPGDSYNGAVQSHDSLGTSYVSSLLSRSVEGTDQDASSADATAVIRSRTRTFHVEMQKSTHKLIFSDIIIESSSFGVRGYPAGGEEESEAPETPQADNPVAKFVKDILIPFAQRIMENGKTFYGQLQNIWADQTGNESKDSLAKKILMSLLDFVEMILDDFYAFMKAVFDAAQDLIEVACNAMSSPIELPLLSSLYRLIFQTEPPSILDLCCFITVIPLTFGLKALQLATGYTMPSIAPFCRLLKTLKVPDLSQSSSVKNFKKVRDLLVSPWDGKTRRRSSGHSRKNSQQSGRVSALSRRNTLERFALFDGDADAWNTYGKAGIGHSLMTLPEVFMNVCMVSKKLQEISTEFAIASGVFEFFASAFSFPNLHEVQDDDDGTLKSAVILEGVAWGIRIVEVFLEVTLSAINLGSFSLGETLTTVKPWLNIGFTCVESLVMLAANILRAKHYNNTDSSEHADRVANGIAFGEIISSVATSICANVAEANLDDGDPEFAVIFSGLAAFFGTVDFALDFGRALYMREHIYRAVTF